MILHLFVIICYEWFDPLDPLNGRPRSGPPPSAAPPDAARGRGLREKLGAVPEIFCCSLDGRHLNVFQALVEISKLAFSTLTWWFLGFWNLYPVKSGCEDSTKIPKKGGISQLLVKWRCIFWYFDIFWRFVFWLLPNSRLKGNLGIPPTLFQVFEVGEIVQFTDIYDTTCTLFWATDMITAHLSFAFVKVSFVDLCSISLSLSKKCTFADPQFSQDAGSL